MKAVTHPVRFQRSAAALAFASRLAFGLALILIPFRLRLALVSRPFPPVYPDYTDLLVFASEVAVLCTLALWSPSLALSRRSLSLGPRYLWIPLAILTAVGGASAAFSYDPVLSIYQALRLAVLFWFYVYVVNEVRSIKWIVVPVTIQVILQSVVALGQFIAQHSLGLQTLGESNLEPTRLGVGVVIAQGVRLLRAYGLTDHPNILGGCLAFGLVLLLGAYLHGSSRPAILAAFAAGVPALLVTFSRSAWLAFIAGCAIVLAAEIAHHRWDSLKALVPLAAAAAVLVVSIILSYSGFFGVRLGFDSSYTVPSIEQQSIGQRAILLDLSLPLLVQHPFLGVGLGASPLALWRSYPGFTLPYEPPHLALVDAALETGWAGALAYLILLLAPFVMYARHWRFLFADRFATVSIALLFSLAVVGVFDYYTWLLAAGRLWQWLAWGTWGLAAPQWPAFQLAPHPLTARKAGVSV